MVCRTVSLVKALLIKNQVIYSRCSSNRLLFETSWTRSLSSSAVHNSVESGRENQPPLIIPKYTESAAAKVRAEHHLYGIDPEDEFPPSTKYVVKISFAIVLIYLIFLREENDVDQKLNASLFDAVPHIEVPMLMATIEAYKLEKKSTTELETRLKQLTGQDYQQLKEEHLKKEATKKK